MTPNHAALWATATRLERRHKGWTVCRHNVWTELGLWLVSWGAYRRKETGELETVEAPTLEGLEKAIEGKEGKS